MFKFIFKCFILIRNFGSKVILKIFGWKDVGIPIPKDFKGILIIAPHTSNWDAWWSILYSFAFLYPFKIRGVFKKELFFLPIMYLYKSMGGIPISKKKKGFSTRENSMVNQLVEVLNKMDKGALVILPEGTRSLITRWRKGFYFIAQKARVPILVGKIDYLKKEMGVVKIFNITGDFESDMKEINKYYKDANPKFPKKFSLHKGPE